MKHLSFAVVSFIVCMLIGCHKDGSVPNGMTEEQRANEAREMDVFISEWYMHQSNAANYLESYFDVKFGSVSYKRTPNSIIREQQKNIALIRARNVRGKEWQEPDLGKWYACQLDAANVLRRLMKEPIINPNSKLDYEALLRLQEADWDAIKRVVVTLHGVDAGKAQAWLAEHGYEDLRSK
jgi:hypothetical protein